MVPSPSVAPASRASVAEIEFGIYNFDLQNG